MHPTNFSFWLGSVAITGQLGTASVAQQAPTSRTGQCFGLSCPVQPVAEEPTKSATRAPDKPYDWKASFAAYRVGKVPLTSLRTTQVVDPPNGRLPPLTPAAREQRTRADYLLNRPATGPEDRPLSSRCVRPIGVGPAFTGSGPGGQESTLEIIQSPQAVVVRVEALRSQLIYLDGRPRPPAAVHLETGAARGHWEGDTLVVEYTNFPADADGTARKRLTERWKRLDDTHLLYGFTMDDPGTRTKPYSVEFVMWRLTDQEQLVEYACHEGNVNLEFTLSGARAKEREEEPQEK